MSFEGYYQMICKKGHLWHIECYNGEPELVTCTHKVAGQTCGQPTKWWNLVDTTNGSFDDDGVTRIDGYLEPVLLKDAERCICTSCGHKHHLLVEGSVSLPEYEPPKEGGHLCGESSDLGKS